jgi:hypothetical protein
MESNGKEPEWIDALENELKITQGSERGEAFLIGYREGLIRAFKIAEQSFTAILEVVDEQAKDEGLWFESTTAPEAYLQQELRRLHGIIEFEISDDDEEEEDES